ncbi:conserved hypothetical protein [Neptunomonas japonica JAMM 1380]|uniref:Phosphate-selective porin O and P n=2 Tax=Neptunomonas TaxID=75687 RepID=A0A7R6PB68_9GAMM|nr:conserved hypothetical protein [Neptunomonas japonica JAMM 1380]
MFLFVSCNTLAQEGLSDWYWGGVLTQGLSRTDNNNFSGKSSERVSSDFRELAVHATWRATSQLHLAGQVMSRKFGAVDNGELQLDYLLADFGLSSDVSREYGVRIGRVKLPYGFYNETRDVAFTRPSIALPQSIYFNTTRELQLSADGMMLYGNFPIAGMRIDIDFLIGRPRESVNTEYGYFRADFSGKFEDDLGVLSRVSLVDGADAWVMGVTLGQFDLIYHPGPIGELGLNDGKVSIDVAILGGQYNTESLSFTAEYMLLSVDRSDLGGAFEKNGKSTSESYYLQAEYRFAKNWDFMLRYDVFFLNKNDRNGFKAEQRSSRPAYSQWTKDYTLGIGWQASPNMSFRAEWHSIKGAGWLAIQDNLDASKLEKDWNLYLLQAAYRF